MKPWAKREFLIVSLVVIAFVALIVVLIMFNKPGDTGPVCNEPYIVMGTDCCLDQNANKICDDDEAPAEETNELTGNVVTDTEEEIEEIGPSEIPPRFEAHIKLKGSIQDKAELTCSVEVMQGVELYLRNLESEDIRCDVEPYYDGDLIAKRVSRNVKVEGGLSRTFLVHDVSSLIGDNYIVEHKVTCKYEEGVSDTTNSVKFTANFN
jgi:hypothetical protein